MAELSFKFSAALALGLLAVTGSTTLVQAQSRTDWLSTGESVTYNGSLYAGESVYATCDGDCTDLDISLYDANSGQLVDSDVLTNAQPIVVAPYDGNFMIEVTMVSCSWEPCAAWTASDYGF